MNSVFADTGTIPFETMSCLAHGRDAVILRTVARCRLANSDAPLNSALPRLPDVARALAIC